MYLLDTTAISALMRSEAEASRRLLALSPHEVAVPQPVLAEIQYGLTRLPRSKRRRELEKRFEIVCAGLPRAEWTDEVSRRFGNVKAALEQRGRRIDDFDVAIAAHALAKQATVVTENVRHFREIPGLAVECWASPRP
jgi:tRNA(fMet)-specific endonuclease VapC